MYKQIFILALFFTATLAHYVQHEEPKVDGAADEAKKLYYKLLEVMGEAINEANVTCNQALNALKDYVVQVETEAKAQIQSTLDSFQAQFDQINQKAKELGRDISECRKYEVQFTSLPDTKLDEIAACVNNQITAAQNQVNDALSRASAIQQDFINIEKEIDDCGSGFKAALCLAKLVAKIGQDTIEGPSKIKTDVDNTVQIIQNAWPEIKKCATDSVEKTPAQAAQIAKDFALCAALP